VSIRLTPPARAETAVSSDPFSTEFLLNPINIIGIAARVPVLWLTRDGHLACSLRRGQSAFTDWRRSSLVRRGL